MGTDNDNKQEPAGQQEAPGGEEAQRSWLTALASDANQVGVGLTTMAAAYGAKKGIDKIRKPPAPPPPAAGPGNTEGGEG